MAFTLADVPLLVRSRYALLYLVSYEERRVEDLLREYLSEEGIGLYRWRSTRGLIKSNEPIRGTQEPVDLLRHILSVPEPAVFLLADFHVALRDEGVVRLLRDLEPILAAREQAVVVVSPTLYVPHALEKDLSVIDVPLPGARTVRKLLDGIIARDELFVPLEVREQLTRAALGLTMSEIQRMLTRIRLDGGMLTQDDVQQVIQEKQRAIRRSKMLEFWPDTERLGSVGGMDALKGWLSQREEAFSGKARAYGLPSPKGVFLLGVQGCGKSLMAKAVAGHWRMPLLRLDLGAVFQVVSDAESGLRETIKIAESLAPVVLWIDELEKGFMASKDDGSSRALGTFLTWMQEKTASVFVVATANDVRMLPPELLRKGRFDEIFFVDLPNIHERLLILDIHLRRRRRDPERFDLTQLAEETERFSGAELEQVVVAAMFKAFAVERELRLSDMVDVARATVPLAVTMDDALKELREWARPRARRASEETRRVDFFQAWE